MGVLRRAASALAGLTVVAGLAGCAGVTEEAVERATGAEVDVDGGEVRIEHEDGSFTASSSGDLPDDFPEAVVLPQDYRVTTASEQAIEGQVGFILIGSIEAAPADVVDRIEAAYELEPTQSAQVGAVRTLEYADVDGYKVGYTVNEDADGNAVVTVAAHPVLG